MAFFTQTNKKKITYEFLLVSSPLEDIIFNVKIVLNGVKYYTASCLSGSWLLPREGTNHYNYQEKTLQSRIKAYRGGNLFLPLSHFTNNSDHIIPISQHSQYFLLIDLGKFAGEVFRDSEVSHVFQQYAADSGAVSEHKTYGEKGGLEHTDWFVSLGCLMMAFFVHFTLLIHLAKTWCLATLMIKSTIAVYKFELLWSLQKQAMQLDV